MVAEVEILVEGYTNAGKAQKERTCPTITLIRDGDITMVVDPGVLKDQEILAGELAKRGLSVNDINTVCITHSHIDHYRNVGMFPSAKVLEFYGVWKGDTVEERTEKFSQNIQVVSTPGHHQTDITLFVKTKNGIVAVCGDVFWKENFPYTPEEDIYALDKEKLKKSRELVIKTADWIIPGHGKIFKAKKNLYGSKQGAPKRKKEAEDTFTCQRCRQVHKKEDSCLCQPRFCFKCCECDMDCNFCNCSHKRKFKNNV